MSSAIKGALASLAIALVAAAPTSAAPSVPELAYDINPGPSSSWPANMTEFKGGILLAAHDGVHGQELWFFDGKKGRLVADIQPGHQGSYPHSFTVAGNYAYFIAETDAHGFELWRTDGTAAGTILLKDIYPGANTSYPNNMQALGNSILFRAESPGGDTELWRSNGTPAGTEMVKKINPGGSSEVNWLVRLGEYVYFRAYDGALRTIWRSDGTAAGTVSVEVAPTYSSPTDLGVVGDKIFFRATNGGSNYELWKLDSGGSAQVLDINPGANPSNPALITDIDGVAYFTAQTDTAGRELWRSDGTAAGTAMVKDVNPGPLNSTPQEIVKVGNRVLFTAIDEEHGGELWSTDGTPGGTRLVKDIYPGPRDGLPRELTELGGQAYFFADSVNKGFELWRTDGSSAVLIGDIFPGSDGQAGDLQMARVGDTIYFSANDGVHGNELWRLAEPKKPMVAPTIKIAAGALKLDAKGRIKVKLNCAPGNATSPCKGQLTLATARKVKSGGRKAKARKLTLARKLFTVPAGKTQVLTVKLKLRFATLLRSNRAARRVKLTAKLRTGPTTTRTLTVKPVKRKPGRAKGK